MTPGVTPGERAGRAGSWRPPLDAVAALTLFAVTLVVLPSRYVFGPLGGAGTPAQVLGLGMALWWAADWLGRPWPTSGLRQPIRRAAFAFLATALISYAVATTRPINAEELASADRGMLSIVSWTAVLLVVMDGVTTRARLDTLLRRLVLLGGLQGALGVVQFFTGESFTHYLRLPGLTENGSLFAISVREGFLRPSGTAIHPIEFGFVLTMVLPIALHYAVADRHRSAAARWFPVAAIAMALPMSISRSAILGTVVALAVLLPTWPRALRRRVYAGGIVLVGCMFVMLPGMLGSLLGLFTGIGNDTSARSRTDSYALAWAFIEEAPVFGRGLLTFLPSYRILDNQYLGSLIEIGAVGVAALLLLYGTSTVTGWRLRRLEPVPRDDAGRPLTPTLGPALAASIASGALGFALFDAFSFPMAAGLMFFVLGFPGALRRLTVEGDRPDSDRGFGPVIAWQAGRDEARHHP